MVWDPCAALRGNLRCSAKAGSRSNSPSAQTIASPYPLLPALLGPARRAWETKTDAGRLGRALRVLAGARSRIRFFPPSPFGWAEQRRWRRCQGRQLFERSEFCRPPPESSSAGCELLGSDTNFAVVLCNAPAGRAEGSANLGSDPKNSQTVGSPFLCLLSFGDAKESELPPGNPRLAGAHQQRESSQMSSELGPG